MPDALLFTCEHASAAVPRAYQVLFGAARARQALASHRGVDIGALEVARRMGRAFGAPLVTGQVTRLLVDLNRSPSHPRLFSEYSRALSEDDKRRLVSKFYSPYRVEVTRRVQLLHKKHPRVLHISVHSFTPRLSGSIRRADVGLLYDPRRAGEASLARDWQIQLLAKASWLRVRRNYPYQGKTDGLTSSLRKLFGGDQYLGIELELNQQFFVAGKRQRATEVQSQLIESLRGIIL